MRALTSHSGETLGLKAWRCRNCARTTWSFLITMSRTAVILAPVTLLIDLAESSAKYSEYLKQSVARDLRRSYKRSSLGYVWSMLNPLFMMLILTAVFSRIMHMPAADYAVFLFAAILPWQYFQQTVLGGMGTIQSNHLILSQVPVPKYVFALSLACSNLVNFGLSLVPLAIVTLMVGKSLSFSMLALPLVILPLFLFSLGATIFLSILNVFFDDTRHLVNIGMQALYFLTPIIYGKEHLPETLRTWLKFNPMYYIIELSRATMYYGELPNLQIFVIAMAMSVVMLVAGLAALKATDHKLIYFL
ncbi:MAG: ABC transporter permease [Proteobacteria bacterium]|nr:ABC transporter permease [Pseudomonadota bacterium]